MRPYRRPRVELLPFVLGLAGGGALLSLVAPVDGRLASALAFPALPAAEFGVPASSRAVEAAMLQSAAVDGLAMLLAFLGGLVLLLSVITAAILITARGSLRGHDVAVRGALGAPRRTQLRRLLVLDARPLLGRGLALGLLGGALAVGGLRWTWPGGAGGAPGPLALPAVLLAATVVAAAALLPLRYAGSGAAPFLAAGGRASSGPREGGVRRILTVLQLTGSLAILTMAAVLVDAGRVSPGPASGANAAAGSTVLLSVSIPRALDGTVDPAERARIYRELVERVRRLPTVQAESIATPGAWSGLGRRDFVLADCGACVRGGLPVPILGEDAFQHAVSPGFFASAGIPLLAGRDFEEGDALASAPVAVVNETYALANFERGAPVGRHVRLGTRGGQWYRVIGVVGDVQAPAVGRAGTAEPAVYLSAYQHPPDRATLSVSYPDGQVPPNLGPISRPAAPLEPSATPLDPSAASRGPSIALHGSATTVSELRAQDAAPLRWTGRVAAGAGLVTVLVAVLGAGAVAGVEVRARRKELGVRMAVGATAAAVTRYVLGRSLRTALLASILAIPVAVGLSARLEELVGAVPLFRPGPFLVVAALVSAAAVAGARGPAVQAGATEPGLVLKEE